MRWVLVKLVNLLIVLVIVTFIVVAIFAGPMAEIEKIRLEDVIRQQVMRDTTIPSELKFKIVQKRLQEAITARGLDKPWYYHALRYMKNLLLLKPLNATVLASGYWHQGSRNVHYIIGERIPFSILLFTTSSIFTLLFSIPLALYAARRPGSIVDNLITSWSVLSVSMPWWWVAMVFIWIFAYKYHIFAGPDAITDWRNIKDVLNRMALPVITVTIMSIGDTAFRIRNILLDIFMEDFVSVARAKGMPETIVLRRHVLRTAAPPIITIALFAIVLSVVSGAIITELVFNWYGMGRLYWEAIRANDMAVLIELTYITTLLYLVVRFILDLLYVYLDPRIRRA